MLVVLDSLGVFSRWLMRLHWWWMGLWFACGGLFGRGLFAPSCVQRRAGMQSLAPLGARIHARVRTGVCADLRVRVGAVRTCVNAQTRARVRLHGHPRSRSDAFGCARAGAPIYILSPPKTFLSNFCGSGLRHCVYGGGCWEVVSRIGFRNGSLSTAVRGGAKNFEQMGGPLELNSVE